MDDVNTAVCKAKKRASVISALDGMYNKAAAPTKSTMGGATSADATLKQGGREKMAQSLIQLAGDTSEKFRNSIDDQIVGKTIVLEKNKQPENTVSKVKRAMRSRNRMSNRELKRKSCHPGQQLSEMHQTESDISLLRRMWWGYASSILCGGKSRTQIQSRMLTLDMVGAQVMVVERSNELHLADVVVQRSISNSGVGHTTSTHGVKVTELGLWGTIVGESMNTFSIALPHKVRNSPATTGGCTGTAVIGGSSECLPVSDKGTADEPARPRAKRRRHNHKNRKSRVLHIEDACRVTNSGDTIPPNFSYYFVRNYVKRDCVFAVKVPYACLPPDVLVSASEAAADDMSEEDEVEGGSGNGTTTEAGATIAPSQVGGGEISSTTSPELFGIALIHGKSFLPHLKHGFMSVGTEG